MEDIVTAVKQYLRQLTPHAKTRRAAQLLEQMVVEVDRLETRVCEAEAVEKEE